MMLPVVWNIEAQNDVDDIFEYIVRVVHGDVISTWRGETKWVIHGNWHFPVCVFAWEMDDLLPAEWLG